MQLCCACDPLPDQSYLGSKRHVRLSSLNSTAAQQPPLYLELEIGLEVLLALRDRRLDRGPPLLPHPQDGSRRVVIEDCHVRAGDDCMAFYSMSGPSRDIFVRNVTCYTPISVTHGHDTRNVTFENCTVYGNWGRDGNIKP